LGLLTLAGGAGWGEGCPLVWCGRGGGGGLVALASNPFHPWWVVGVWGCGGWVLLCWGFGGGCLWTLVGAGRWPGLGWGGVVPLFLCWPPVWGGWLWGWAVLSFCFFFPPRGPKEGAPVFPQPPGRAKSPPPPPPPSPARPKKNWPHPPRPKIEKLKGSRPPPPGKKKKKKKKSPPLPPPPALPPRPTPPWALQKICTPAPFSTTGQSLFKSIPQKSPLRSPPSPRGICPLPAGGKTCRPPQTHKICSRGKNEKSPPSFSPLFSPPPLWVPPPVPSSGFPPPTIPKRPRVFGW